MSWVFALGFLLLVPTIGKAAVLGSETSAGDWSINEGEHRLRPKLFYIDSYRGLFDDTWVDSTSVGTVLVTTADTDTDFAFIAGRLTNGTAEYLCFGFCEEIECQAKCKLEQSFFELSSPDFSPATVSKVSLRIDSLSFGLDPRGGQLVSLGVTLTIEGESGTPVRRGTWGQLKATYH